MYKLDEEMLYDLKFYFTELKEIYRTLNNIQVRFIDFEYYKYDAETNRAHKITGKGWKRKGKK